MHPALVWWGEVKKFRNVFVGDGGGQNILFWWAGGEVILLVGRSCKFEVKINTA